MTPEEHEKNPEEHEKNPEEHEKNVKQWMKQNLRLPFESDLSRMAGDGYPVAPGFLRISIDIPAQKTTENTVRMLRRCVEMMYEQLSE